MIESSKTTREYWESTHSPNIRMNLPSPLVIGVANIQRLLKKFVRPGMRVLEIGFTPGKMLAWVNKVLGATICGVDYSRIGIETSRRLFRELGVIGDLRCEDFAQTTFAEASFDVVYSFGVVEHFEEPAPWVKKHVAMLKPGGIAVVMIPHYGGIYGKIQRKFDAEILKIHNLDIMNRTSFAALAPPDLSGKVLCYPWGRISPGFIDFHKKWGVLPTFGISCVLNVLGLLQPFDIPSVSPMLVLEIHRRDWGPPIEKRNRS